MAHSTILYREHADRRRKQQSITSRAVRAVIEEGMVLRRYPEDRPFESRLMMGWEAASSRTEARTEASDRRPIHVVCADDEEAEITWIITVYEPDPEIWEDDFRWKKEWKSTKNTWRE